MLFCGILSSLLYIGTDIFAALQFPGYSFVSQSISELQAIGAPTRFFVISLLSLHNLLAVFFGSGVMLINERKRARVTGILLIASAVELEMLLFFPMHLRGAGITLTDVMHVILTIINEILMALFIGFGAGLLGRRFRLYSVGTILIFLLFGLLAGIEALRLAVQLPTPGFGVLERINIYASMLWATVLSVGLLRKERYPDKGGVAGR